MKQFLEARPWLAITGALVLICFAVWIGWRTLSPPAIERLSPEEQRRFEQAEQRKLQAELAQKGYAVSNSAPGGPMPGSGATP